MAFRRRRRRGRSFSPRKKRPPRKRRLPPHPSASITPRMPKNGSTRGKRIAAVASLPMLLLTPPQPKNGSMVGRNGVRTKSAAVRLRRLPRTNENPRKNGSSSGKRTGPRPTNRAETTLRNGSTIGRTKQTKTESERKMEHDSNINNNYIKRARGANEKRTHIKYNAVLTHSPRARLTPSWCCTRRPPSHPSAGNRSYAKIASVSCTSDISSRRGQTPPS